MKEIDVGSRRSSTSFRAGVCAALISLLFCAACAGLGDYSAGYTRIDRKEHGFTKHFQESAFLVSEQRQFSLELLVAGAQPLRIGDNRLYLIVHNALDGDVEGAEVVASYRGEGAAEPVSLEVTDRGLGLYEISRLVIDHASRGELAVVVRGPGETDRARFVLSVEQ